MREFFTMIYGEASGLACITRCDVKGKPTLDKYFEYPAQLEEMLVYCENYADRDLYFTPVLSAATNRRAPSMVQGQALWSDSDTFDVENFKVAPSIIVHTSEGRTHSYWVLDDVHDAAALEKVTHSISAAHPKKETGLDTGWARNKLMRVPGTTNLNHGDPYKIAYVNEGLVYSLSEIETVYEPIEPHAQIEKKRDAVPSRIEALNSIEMNASITDILSNDFAKGNRSEALHFAEMELFRAGATDEQAFAILVDSNLNKWELDGLKDSDDMLWQDILRARAKFEPESTPADEAPEPVKATVVPRDYGSYDFLDENEKDMLQATWVDDFVAWSASKTNASKDFQIASAFTVLSTVFSDFGSVPTRWGDTYLNLWFMVLGRTTLDRKSTVKSHMLKVLNRLSDGDEYIYDLGSNFTVEGLSDVAREMPNRSGVVVRDEIQGFLRELSNKTYMAGTKETLTDLYGGRLTGKLRSTGEKKRAKSTNYFLSFYGMGIQDQVGAELDSEDFGSGFLTRFIWVEPTDIEERSEDVNDGFELGRTSDDNAFYDLCDSLRSARDHYEMFADSLDAEPQPIEFEVEAFERIKKFRADMVGEAENLSMNVVAPADRLTHSVLKCAALLAMSECSESVQLRHAVSAINYASGWFLNMLKMSEKVAESDWKRQQDTILEEIIIQGNDVSPKKLYNKFRTEMKPREFAELVQSLQDSGHLVTIRDDKDNKRYRYVEAE